MRQAPRFSRTAATRHLALVAVALAGTAQAASLSATPLTLPAQFVPSLLGDNGTLYGVTGSGGSQPAQFAAGQLSMLKLPACAGTGILPPQRSAAPIGVLPTGQAAIWQTCATQVGLETESVSYTHLTLPTIYSV